MHCQQKVLFFDFPWNVITNKKTARHRQKLGLFCINSGKIYKQILKGKLNHFRSSVILLSFVNINKKLWSTLFCIVYYK